MSNPSGSVTKWAVLLACLSVMVHGLAQDAPAQIQVLEKVAFEQKPGEAVDTDLVFTDSTGTTSTLANFLGERPTVLVLGYYECPMLCHSLIAELARTARQLSLRSGRDYAVLFVSVDPQEGPADAARAKNRVGQQDGVPNDLSGWEFLTGGAEEIEALSSAVGFRYAYDPASGQFAHPAGIVLLTSDGTVSHYLFGTRFSVRDLQLALVEASNHTIGSVTDQILLRCYRYDPSRGRYGFAIMSALRVLCVGTALGLGATVLWFLRKERLHRQAEQGGPAA